MKRHLTVKHDLKPQQVALKSGAEEKVYKCPLCYSKTKTKSAYNRHLFKKHGIKDPQCLITKPTSKRPYFAANHPMHGPVEPLDRPRKRKRREGVGDKMTGSDNGASAALKTNISLEPSSSTAALPSKRYPFVDENQRPLKIYEVVYNYDMLCQGREKVEFPSTPR